MRFKLFAVSKDSSASYQQTFECSTNEEAKECFEDFELDAKNALCERFYMEYDGIDTEDATIEQLDFLQDLANKF